MERKQRMFLLMGLFLLLAACACGPAKWAEDLENRVKCGMNLKEVEQLSGYPIKELNRTQATHYIGEELDDTEVWLTFKDDKLQAIQLAWAYKLKKMASAQKSICAINDDGRSRGRGCGAGCLAATQSLPFVECAWT